MKIRITNFGGELPGVHPRLLPDSAAQIATNVRLYRGDLHPTRQPRFETSLGSGVVDFFRYQDTWYSFASPIDMAPGPVDTDRIYITGDGVPKMRVGATEYDLKIPAAVNPPDLLLVPGPLGGDTTLHEDVLYAYTYVTSFGEESAPSPTGKITWEPGQAVRVDNFDAAPAGRGVDTIRIYRSQTALSGVTELYFVDEIAIATGSYDHDIELAPLQEVIPSNDYDPPVDDLEGITVLPNGLMAAFRGKELFFCEPYLPHAWPSKYSLTTDHDIQALVAFGATLAVLTDGVPYIVEGTAPDTMTMSKSDQALPCVSGEGAVDLGYAAAYPSVEGLVLIDNSGGRLVTERIFTREQWSANNPETFVATEFNGRYLFSYEPDGTTSREFGMLDFRGEVPTFIRAEEHCEAFYLDQQTKQTFFLKYGGEVFEWEARNADLKTLLWRSKLFQTVSDVAFAAILVEAEIADAPDEPVMIARVFCDGQAVCQSDKVNQIDRLKVCAGRKWEIEIETNMEVSAVSIATSVEELAAGP